MIYLYIKVHSITGLKYFGVHRSSKNPWKYLGSGKYWKAHIKKYGTQYVKTIEVFGFDCQEDATEFALKFSIDNDIVDSKEWANQIVENALPNNTYGIKYSDEVKKKMSFSQKGRKLTEEHKKKLSQAKIGKKISEDTKKKMSQSHKGRIFSEESIEKMRQANLGRKVSTETKMKISLNQTGKKRGPHTEETKKKMSEAKKGFIITEEHKKKLSQAKIGKKISEDTKKKMSEAKKGIPKPIVVCPHCNKSGGASTMGRWHFDNCNFKNS